MGFLGDGGDLGGAELILTGCFEGEGRIWAKHTFNAVRFIWKRALCRTALLEFCGKHNALLVGLI